MNLLLTNLTLLKPKLGTHFNHLLNRKPVIMSCSDTIVTKETGTSGHLIIFLNKHI